MLQRDMRAATCRGVQPATSARSRAGRCLSSSRTTLQEPERQATSHSIWGLYMHESGGSGLNCNARLGMVFYFFT